MISHAPKNQKEKYTTEKALEYLVAEIAEKKYQEHLKTGIDLNTGKTSVFVEKTYLHFLLLWDTAFEEWSEKEQQKLLWSKHQSDFEFRQRKRKQIQDENGETNKRRKF